MKIFFVQLILLCFALLAIPVQTIEAPEWEILVVNSHGDPVNGVTVREVFRDYSVPVQQGEHDLITSEQGKVIFPKREARISFARRVLGVASSIMAEGVHASFGRHAHVFAFGKCEGDPVKNGYVEDWTGHPAHNKSTIICRTAGEK